MLCCLVHVLAAAHLLRVVDPATGKQLEPHKLKAEVAAFMAAGEAASRAASCPVQRCKLLSQQQQLRVWSGRGTLSLRDCQDKASLTKQVVSSVFWCAVGHETTSHAITWCLVTLVSSSCLLLQGAAAPACSLH